MRLPTVLVVEDLAHVASGHFPTLFTLVADGFSSVGCPVAILTSRGWYRAGPASAPHSVYRYGRVATVFNSLADALQVYRWSFRAAGWLRRAGDILRVVVMTRAAAARARRVSDDTVVVIVSIIDPRLIPALARQGRWLVFAFRSPRDATTTIGRFSDRATTFVAEVVERHRRARGACTVVAMPTTQLRDQWIGAWPRGNFAVVQLPESSEEQPIPDARRQLGIDQSLKVALFFGAKYAAKDTETVLDAFSTLDEWNLVVGGSLCESLSPSARVLRRFPGYVDDRVRALLYSAADLVVISFYPGFARISGTLRDAIGWGLPVVCSEPSAPAELVRKYRLGTVFEAGDAASLARAVQSAPTNIQPVDLARVRAERSRHVSAEQALRALDVFR
jgi:glycosyltransferase involved in cell wall biosynthesis